VSGYRLLCSEVHGVAITWLRIQGVCCEVINAKDTVGVWMCASVSEESHKVMAAKIRILYAIGKPSGMKEELLRQFLWIFLATAA
jgi:hypothetical protein